MMKILFGFFLLIQIMGCASQRSPGTAKEFPFLLNEKNESIQSGNLKYTSHGPFTENEAKNFFASRELAITQLLEPKIDPYKGEDSTPAECRKENLPQDIKGSKPLAIAISLYSSDNMILGSCADPQHLLKTQYQMLYCAKDQRAYVIQYYYSKNQPWRSDFIANCLP